MQNPTPLVFSFQQFVQGAGFLASVTMCGRAVLEESADETWITGVAPVGLAGGGVDRSTAFADFRRAWAEILFDIACESSSFAELERRSAQFLGSSLDELSEEWDAALAQMRATSDVDSTLQRVPADEQQVSFQVVELKPGSGAPDENRVEAGLRAAG